MISVIRFAATMCLGENAPISRCLRNHVVIRISQALQGVLTVASTVTSVACFYVGFDDPTSNREILFTTGGFSLLLTVISCCGNLYICDFKRVIDEGKLRKAVGEAGRDIAVEASHVRRDVRSFAEAQLAITSSVNSLEEHVKIAGKKIEELEGEFHSAKAVHEAASRSHEELRIDIERVAEHSSKLDRACATAAAIHLESMETRTDAIRRLEALEKRVVEEEDEIIRGYKGTALTVAKAAKFEEIEREMIELADKDPHAYREFVRRIPGLRFV